MRILPIRGRGLVLALGLVLAGSLAHAQERVWVVTASETRAMAVAQGVTRGEVEQRALKQCASPTCRITEARQGGCAGAVRALPVGPVRTFNGASRTEWDGWLARECPARNCPTVITCAPVVSSSSPTVQTPSVSKPSAPSVPSAPSIPSMPKLPTIR